MEMDHVRLYVLMCVKIVMCVQAQVTFNPDPEEDVQLQLTVLNPPVNITTIQCYLSSPKFTVQYVNENQAVYDLSYYGTDDFTGHHVNASACGNSRGKYRIVLNHLRFIADPVLVGGTFRLKATLDNNEENSTMSGRTYTFPARFNLTGSSVSASLGSPFTWTCHVTSDYRVIERNRGSTTLRQFGILNGACVTFGQNDSYNYECQQSALTYTLTTPGSSLTEELQGSTWRCRDATTEVKGSEFRKLNIVVPVTTITISPGGGSTISVDENQTITFTCTTNDANPAPTILWFIGSSDATSQATGSNRTTLTLNVTRADHQMSVRCTAWNIGNTANLSDSTTLHVRLPPASNEELQITGYTSGQVLYENQSIINIYCTQPGGNPLANMTLTCGSGTITNESTATEVILRVDLENDRNLNCKNCICESTNIIGYMRNQSFSFIVYYPPGTPTVSISSPFPWKANESQNLTCNTTPGNPPATTYIWKEGESELSTTSLTYGINPLQSSDNGRMLHCQVNNNFTLHENVVLTSANTTLQVLYPPANDQELRIMGYASGQVLYENNPAMTSINCTQYGGNPVVNMTFTCGSNTGINGNTATEAVRRLNLANDRTLNGQNCTCVSTHINGYTRNKSVSFNVYYDPVVTLEQSLEEVIEGRTAVLRCSGTGNPAPTVTWYRDSTPVTANTISSSNYSIVNVSRTATGNYTCEGKSSSTGSNVLQPDQKTAHLRVFYPPTVLLYSENTTENTENHVIRCSAEGDPNNSTFVALQQRIGSILIRNITSFTESSPGNMTQTIPRVSYQDMGTYTCLASNGIPDRSNQKIQSDTAYFNVITSAKFEMMKYTVRSDIGTAAAISIPFYRNPPATESDVMWINNTGTSNETSIFSPNVSVSLSDTDVNRMFHGVHVTLKGKSAKMDIPIFQDYYEGNYTLNVRNSHTESEEVRIALIRSGPPDTPSDFQLLIKKVTSVVLTWNKGSDGGHPQTFVILYKETTAEVYKREDLDDTTMNKNITYEIKGLKPDTNYDFLLYTFNEKGNSTSHNTLEKRTLKAPEASPQSPLNSGLVGGAAGGGAALLVVMIIIIVVMRRRHYHGKGSDSRGILNNKEMSAGTSRQDDYDDGEDGLKNNPLYGSGASGTSGTSSTNAVQGARAAPGNPSLYAEVVKPKRKHPANVSDDPPPIYAEVDKSNKKGKGPLKPKKKSPAKRGEDPPPIYAEVNKPNKKGDKGKQKQQKAKGKIEGDVYENVGGFKEKETQFNDPAEMQETKGNEPRGYRNQDGLLYVDVKFDQPPPTGKPVIRGEERTGYAMIEFEEPPTFSTADDVKGADGGI